MKCDHKGFLIPYMAEVWNIETQQPEKVISLKPSPVVQSRIIWKTQQLICTNCWESIVVPAAKMASNAVAKSSEN